MTKRIAVLLVACVMATSFALAGCMGGSMTSGSSTDIGGSMSSGGSTDISGSMDGSSGSISANESSFVGTWQLTAGGDLTQAEVDEIGPIEYVLYSDGTLMMYVSGNTLTGTWSYSGGNQATGSYSNGVDTAVVNFTLNGDTLTLTSPMEEGSLVFVRV